MSVGINVAGRGEYSPDDLRVSGAKWLRCVAYPDYDLRPWIQRCKFLGFEVLLVVGSETLGNNEDRWAAGLRAYYDRYKGLGVLSQIGNEPDGMPPSSWVMDPPRYQRLWTLARGILQGERLVTAGFCSGHPEWPRDLDLGGAWALAYHPYGRWPGRQDWGFGDIESLHAQYKKAAERQGIGRLVISEVGISTTEVSEAEQAAYYGALAKWFGTQADLEAGLVFCYHDGMVRSFGLLRTDGSKKPSYAAFRDNAGPPLPETPDFELVAAPTALSLKDGEVGRFSVLVRPLGGFSGAVTLVPGSPAALPVKPGSTTVRPVDGKYLLVDYEVRPGSGPVSGTIGVTGSSGLLTHRVAVPVEVAAPPPPPPPPPLPYYVGPGVEAAVRRNNYVLLGPEEYASDGLSLTPTDHGLLVYVKASDKLTLVPMEAVP